MNQTSRAILCGGLVAGTIDIGVAALISRFSPSPSSAAERRDSAAVFSVSP